MSAITPSRTGRSSVVREWESGRVESNGVGQCLFSPPYSPTLLLSTEKQRGRTLARPAPYSSGGKGGIRTLEGDLSPLNRLAGGPIRPLWHLPLSIATEREGFEPPELSLCCFQDSRHRPLGHLSSQ